jgi:hypothetical protein
VKEAMQPSRARASLNPAAHGQPTGSVYSTRPTGRALYGRCGRVPRDTGPVALLRAAYAEAMNRASASWRYALAATCW